MFVAYSSNQYQVTTKCLSFDHVVTLRNIFIRYYRALLDVNYFVPSASLLSRFFDLNYIAMATRLLILAISEQGFTVVSNTSFLASKKLRT